MKKSSVHAKSIILFICVSFVISIFLFLGENAKTNANAIEEAKYDDYKETKDAVGDVWDEILEKKDLRSCNTKIGRYPFWVSAYFILP